MAVNNLTIWIKAARLRTLSLSIACSLMAASLAVFHNCFSLKTFLLITITATLLQILSNISNDLGDTLNGADNENRIGPKRAVQSGEISVKQMKIAINLLIIITLIIGIILISITIKFNNILLWLLFFLVGIASIVAALKYTIGHNPYGYKGLGDLFVFVFFGIIGVAGAFFLYSKTLYANVFLIANTIGLLSVGVLNINNLRDYENDKIVGKQTVPVLIGVKTAKIYHTLIIFIGLISLIIWTLCSYNSYWQFLYIITFPLFFKHLFVIFKNQNSQSLNNELKNLAIYTLLLTIVFGFSINISHL